MNVILSIKPKYCDEITNGRKKVEFRKKLFRRTETVSLIFMYSTHPVKKIVGSFKIDSIFEDSPEKLWNQFKDCSGIRESEFFRYFSNSSKGFAITIKDVKSFEPLEPSNLIPGFSPPQSFRYIDDICSEKVTDARSLVEK